MRPDAGVTDQKKDRPTEARKENGYRYAFTDDMVAVNSKNHVYS